MEQTWQTMMYSSIMDEYEAMLYEEPFMWTIIELDKAQTIWLEANHQLIAPTLSLFTTNQILLSNKIFWLDTTA